MDLQVQVLACLFGSRLAKAWKTLLVKRPWYLGYRPLYYAVGQPMGALSSWASMALTHHLIVKIAALRAGIHNFKDYAILGDDVVIADALVANAYLALVTSLGLDISLHKSLVSSTGYFEFAKRLIGPGSECSPFGASLLVLASRSWKFFPVLLLD